MSFISDFHGPALVPWKSFLTSEFNWLIPSFSSLNIATSGRTVESLMLAETFELIKSQCPPPNHVLRCHIHTFVEHFRDGNSTNFSVLMLDNLCTRKLFLISAFPGATWAHFTHTHTGREAQHSHCQSAHIHIFVALQQNLVFKVKVLHFHLVHYHIIIYIIYRSVGSVPSAPQKGFLTLALPRPTKKSPLIPNITTTPKRRNNL